MNDKAIELETSIYKVTKALERLKNIGLNVEKYEKLVEDIIEECNKKTSYKADTFFQNAFIENAYIEAISKLESVYFEFSKYEVYLKVASFNQVLKEYILSKEKSENELEQFRERLLLLLNKLKKSETLDYQVEGPLVEDIYHLTYEFIKEEIKGLGISPILRDLKLDEVHAYNLDKQIVKELESLDLKDNKYAFIVKEKNEIDAQGINATYLDENFISTIIKSTASKEELQKKVSFLVKQSICYYSKAKNLEENIEINKTFIEEQKKLKRICLKKIYGNAALFATSVGIIVGLAVGSFKLSKKIATSKKYTIQVDSYSSTEGKLPLKEETSFKINNSVQLIEYQPYKGPDEYGWFTRTISTYNLSNIEEMDLKEYLNLNLEILGIRGQDSKENKTSLSVSDLYKEAYSIVEKRVTNEVFEEDYSKGVHIVFFCLLLVLSALIDFLIEIFLGETYKDEQGEIHVSWRFKLALDKLISHYQELMEFQNNIKEKENDLKEFYMEAKQLLIDNKEAWHQFEKLLPYLENNAVFNKEIEEVKENLTRVLKIEENSLKK